MRDIDSEFKCTPQDRFAMKRVSQGAMIGWTANGLHSGGRLERSRIELARNPHLAREALP
jgi:hypothetical protein